jgi:hypothetical protein
MFYRVFFDPDVVRPAYDAGPTGMSLLLTIWRGFLLNCSICEVDGYLINHRLGEVVREIAKDAEAQANGLSDYVTRLKKILVQMEKQNRFVDVFSTSKAEQSLALLALLFAESVGVDFILTNQTIPDEPRSPERTGLDGYVISSFERERAKQSDDGLIAEGEDAADDFFAKRFGKLLPLAKRVTIIDGILGRKFGDNFQYTLKRLIQYLESTNADPSELLLDIHTEDGDRIDFLEQRLGEWCSAIRYQVHRHQRVPHERYLFTDQFGLQLGIGCDLLSKETGRNRATDFSYARLSKIHDLLPTA